MKTILPLWRALLVAAGLLLLTTPARAQQLPGPVQPVTRADVSATVSWLAVEKSEPGPFDSDRWHHTAFGAIGAGWYWGHHLKTELDFGAGGDGRSYSSRQAVIDGRNVFITTESRFARRILGISQQYQFYRNQWFHPHVAAGVDVTWERITDITRPIVISDRTGPARVIEPERKDGPRTEVFLTPFFATGFKAYLTPRAFFRSDLRLGIGEGVDDVLVRFGFGMDF